MNDSSSNKNLDAQAVQAIKAGDKDRYSELVQRYADKVYAIAWSRLGDRDLAEEAAQEAFIKGFKNLFFLNSGNKFGSWIASITRNISINFGIRYRKELERRQRWALDPSISVSEINDEETAEKVSDQTLREALSALPPIHRECLVLFYLEGRSISEAATSLSLSETAFKTRLHRARVALREQLEQKLEESLRELRPSQKFAARVMLLLPTQPMGASLLSSGMASALLGFAKKLIPVQFFVFLPVVMGMLSGLLFAGWISKLELRNYKDQQGFRAKLYRSHTRRAFLMTAILFVALILVIAQLFPFAWYIQLSMIVGIFGFAAGIRQLVINRSRAHLFQILSLVLVFSAVAVTVADSGLRWLGTILQGLFFIFTGLTVHYRPLRFDYSLYLRYAQGLLQRKTTIVAGNAAPLSRQEMMAFARFLGTRWLLLDYRHDLHSVDLRLASVRMRWISYLFPIIWRDCSTITLSEHGTVESHLSAEDEQDLKAFVTHAEFQKADLEHAVASTLQEAWKLFRQNDLAGAEAALGEEPETNIFVAHPSRTRAAWWRSGALIAAGALLTISAIYQSQKSNSKAPAMQQAAPTIGSSDKLVQKSPSQVP